MSRRVVQPSAVSSSGNCGRSSTDGSCSFGVATELLRFLNICSQFGSLLLWASWGTSSVQVRFAYRLTEIIRRLFGFSVGACIAQTASSYGAFNASRRCFRLLALC